MYFDEFSIGQHFELSPICLTEEEIYEFAHQYDPQLIHIDSEFAKNGLFKGIIASGFHTSSAIWSQWIRTNRFGWRKPKLAIARFLQIRVYTESKHFVF